MKVRAFPVLALAIICSYLFVCSSANAGIMLTFDAPSPGTILDRNGLGTGFTTRIPFTGGSLPASDLNMDLLADPGYLLLTSTKSDFNNGGVNLDVAEAPGVFLPGIEQQSFVVSARFDNVAVLNLSDQVLLYAGTANNRVFKAGIHEGNIYVATQNNGGLDVNVFTAANAFATGDDLILSLSRANGLWSLAWQNLTNPAASGSIPGVSLPWLDSEPDLYVGISVANARNDTPFTTRIDYFAVDTAIPEPSSLVLFGASYLGLVIFTRRFANSRMGT